MPPGRTRSRRSPRTTCRSSAATPYRVVSGTVLETESGDEEPLGGSFEISPFVSDATMVSDSVLIEDFLLEIAGRVAWVGGDLEGDPLRPFRPPFGLFQGVEASRKAAKHAKVIVDS